MTYTSVALKLLSLPKKEFQNERISKFESHEMGLQISRGVYPEAAQKGDLRRIAENLGEIFRELALQRECKIVEGHLMRDHVHICLSIPPKLSVSNVVG